MAQQLSRRGHEVTLFTVSRDHPLRTIWTLNGDVRVCRTPNLAVGGTGEGYGLLDIPMRCIHALWHRYDIVHMFDHKPNATFPGLPARLRGARLVADWGDWWGGPGGINDVPKRRIPTIGRFESWWEERSKLWADGVVTISSMLQRRAIDLGCKPERVAWIPTGAPTDRIQPLHVAVAREQLGIPLHRRIVGFIGMGQGDLAIVLRALQELPNVWLMIIGKKRPETQRLADAYGVTDRLWQTDFVPDDQVGLYLACADVMCLPMEDRAANRGRFPNKVLDYLAAGRAVVASPVGDIERLLARHKVGLLASEATFASAIQSLLSSPSLRAELGENARRLAETDYAWPHLVDRLEQFYQVTLDEF
jgi:glycosyltransferase involved in cell wall biosynthesis